MKEFFLCKYGELALKGLNKRWFENILRREIIRSLEPYGEFDVQLGRSLITCEPLSDDCDMDGAWDAIRRVFGLAAVSRSLAVEKDMDVIRTAAVEYLSPALRGISGFKVEAKRSDKRFPLNSMEIAREVGGDLLRAARDGINPELRVDVVNPEAVFRIEVREEYAFISAGQEPGAGGMPVGTNGNGLLLLSGGIDSPVAGWMMAKRGIALDALHFESFPYTSERAREKVIELARLLEDWCGEIRLSVVSVTRIQEALRDNCDEEYFTLLLRRFMMRIATKIAGRYRCGALITGESLGQVASQTLQAMAVTEDAAGIPIFRPCIGMDKEEIVRIARRIGTFETSILPYEDCCTVFTPRHPKTRPELEKVLAQEARVDVDTLVAEALTTLTKY
ncbi:MAG: tRNA 4-thiouridine(8) synthase ThiI [Clostridiales bacterium]|nr:tRNA 4-thiouridine(8) synthase ThiI [Clostridiales bacterium]